MNKAIDNFKEWAGTYTVFGGQQLEVDVKINRVYSSANASVVHIADAGKNPRSFAWGGAHPQIPVSVFNNNPLIKGLSVEYAVASTIKAAFDWNPENAKVMGLFGDISIANDKKTPLYTAQHEFGHWLGLQDAYYNDNSDLPWPITGMYPLAGAAAGAYPDYNPSTIMNNHWGSPSVTDNDIEMVVLAFITGRRQNYQKQFPWEEISEAMGSGEIKEETSMRNPIKNLYTTCVIVCIAFAALTLLGGCLPFGQGNAAKRMYDACRELSEMIYELMMPYVESNSLGLTWYGCHSDKTPWQDDAVLLLKELETKYTSVNQNITSNAITLNMKPSGNWYLQIYVGNINGKFVFLYFYPYDELPHSYSKRLKGLSEGWSYASLLNH